MGLVWVWYGFGSDEKSTCAGADLEIDDGLIGVGKWAGQNGQGMFKKRSRIIWMAEAKLSDQSD